MSYAGSHKSASTAAIVLFITCAGLVGDPEVSADSRAPVVRVYDTANGDSVSRTAAIHTAAAIVRDAGIPVEWRDCTGAGSQPDCQTPQRGDLIVRIMLTAPRNRSAGSNSLHLRAAPGEEQLQLGVAVLNPATLAGQMATVFQQPVLRIANRAGIEPAGLLGRTIAHEIGHLLLRTRSHSSTGLMREIWSLEELTSNRRDDWQFAPADRQRLQQQYASAAGSDNPSAWRADGPLTEPVTAVSSVRARR